jgi:hypothetical protein
MCTAQYLYLKFVKGVSPFRLDLGRQKLKLSNEQETTVYASGKGGGVDYSELDQEIPGF